MHIYTDYLLRRTGLIVWLSLSMLGHVAIAESEEIRHERHGDQLYLDCTDVAEALGYELKVVQPDRLITFCRTGEHEICIPIRLVSENCRGTGDELRVAADVLCNSLRCRVLQDGDEVKIDRLPAGKSHESADNVKGYNAPWGGGRGFNIGSRLPDIPLTDMEGNEVRFSAFLGKRYILYCWASW